MNSLVQVFFKGSAEQAGVTLRGLKRIGVAACDVDHLFGLVEQAKQQGRTA